MKHDCIEGFVQKIKANNTVERESRGFFVNAPTNLANNLCTRLVLFI